MAAQNLYNIESLISENEFSYKAKIIINPYDPVFKGHFPGQPVLPGVFTLAMFKECVSIVLKSDLRLSEIKQGKFTGMVDPFVCNILTLFFTLKKLESGFYIEAHAENGERVVLKMLALMVEN